MREIGRSVEKKDIFTKEIEDELIEDKIDVAIHSMKDLTVDLPPGITIAAVPKRANPYDVLISREKRKLMHLPAGSRIGTSSPRRRSQLLAARGDLEVVDIGGNVETRLRKLTSGAYDAIVLAAAGLERLHLEHEATEVLPTNLMLPAIGQGALAIESRTSDDEIIELFTKIDHSITRLRSKLKERLPRNLGETVEHL